MVKLKIKNKEKFLKQDFLVNTDITIKSFMEMFVKGIKDESGFVHFLYGTENQYKFFNVCCYDTEVIENKEKGTKSTRKNIEYNENYEKFMKKCENVIPDKIGIYDNGNVVDYYLVCLNNDIIDTIKKIERK